MAVALRFGDGAEQEQQGADAQQRVLHGIALQFGRVLAVDQDGFADGHLVAGLEAGVP